MMMTMMTKTVCRCMRMNCVCSDFRYKRFIFPDGEMTVMVTVTVMMTVMAVIKVTMTVMMVMITARMMMPMTVMIIMMTTTTMTVTKVRWERLEHEQ